ncbi:MAG TPA: VOC family protein [Acidobacteriota bacterium]|nr:VOC family protein [Acidobacteriota bacterium]
MPTFQFDHIHHETEDVETAIEFYKSVFGARADKPFERGGATWVNVQLGDFTIVVTNRAARSMSRERYQGFDHFAVQTDDFDGTLEMLEKKGILPWLGPLKLETGQRLVFIEAPDAMKIEILEAL